MQADSDLALDLAAEYLDRTAVGPVELAEICRVRPDLIPRVESLLRDGGQLGEAAGKFIRPTDQDDDEPMPERLGRYDLLSVLGEGAMGIAYRGRDSSLNREVAVKLLRTRLANSPNAGKRFIDEARITAQLQHPTIPAVHELGTHPDGRPWMAMKLIKGETLAQLLATESPALNRLAVFESICQGVSYAHSKGVIHRDLKPQNVMVGAFGEVQLLDWGLAKVLGAGPTPYAESKSDETVGSMIATDRDSDGALTRAGTAMGSPAYMPPEQAIGAVDRIDRRSDVFGLGAILCHLLTGKPPFVGADSESTRQLAALGRVEDAFTRLDSSAADPELVALCKRCLAADYAQRPADAEEVAVAVANLRAAAEERAKHAELERERHQVRAGERRKRRRVQLALVAALGLLGLGMCGAAWWYDHQRLEVEKRSRDEEERAESNRRAETERVEKQKRDEEDRRIRTEEELADSLNRCEEMLRANQFEKGKLALDLARKRLPDCDTRDLRERFERCQSDLELLRALDRVDDLNWTLLEGKPIPHLLISEKWQMAFTKFGVLRDRKFITDAAKQLNRSYVRERALGALDNWLLIELELPSELAGLLNVVDPDPFRDAIRVAIASGNPIEYSVEAIRTEASKQPPRYAMILGRIRRLPMEQRRQILMEALERNPGDFALLMTLGALGYRDPVERDRSPEAGREREIWYRSALAVRPRNPVAVCNLGLALADQGNLEMAVRCFQESVRLDDRYATAYNELRHYLLDLTYWKKGVGTAEKALAAARQAAVLEPENPYFQIYVGELLVRGLQYQEGKAFYSEAIRLNASPDTNAMGHAGVAVVCAIEGDASAEKKELDQAREIHLPSARTTVKNNGAHFLRVGQYRNAATCFCMLINLDPNSSEAHALLGQALVRNGQLRAAVDHDHKSIKLDLSSINANNAMGEHYAIQFRFEEARDSFRKSLSIDKLNRYANLHLGIALFELRDIAGAEKVWTAALKFDEKNSMLHSLLGMLCVWKGDFARAEAFYQTAIQLDGNDSRAKDGLANCRRQIELLARLPEVLEGRSKPLTPEEMCEFASLCTRPNKSLFSKSVQFFEDAFAREPSLLLDLESGHRYDAACSAACASRGDGNDAPKEIADKSALRAKSFKWLRQDLAARNKQSASPDRDERESALEALCLMRRDPDFASFRPGLLRMGMPEQERKEWDRFWLELNSAITMARYALNQPK